MFVKFVKIKFRNILSYGNAWTEFDFRDGLNLIKAQNGSGKSAIIDALTFVLFGKPYRDIKMAQLVNNINDGNMEVELEFMIDGTKYEMSRGLKPAKFQIKKNGESLELLSSKRLNQEEIDRIIGIDYNLYRNIVCVASINNSSFLSLNTAEKRSLVESIFNIDILASMLVEVKKRITMDKMMQKSKLASYDGIVENLLTTTSFYNDISEKRKTFDRDRMAKIVSKRKNIDEWSEELLECSKHLDLADRKGKELDARLETLPSVRQDIQDKTVRKGILEQANAENKSKLVKLMDSGDICPLCHSELCNGHATAYRQELRDTIEDNSAEISSITKDLEKLTERSQELSRIDKILATLRLKVIEEKSRKERLEENIVSAETSIHELENTKFTVDVDSYRAKIQELTSRRDILKKELDELDRNAVLNDHLGRILGETGVRQYFFKKLLPVLNAKINHYLDKFELPLTFAFDDLLNASITRGRYEMGYGQFSCGERQRIDMSILLSFFDISKSISNWSCSVLFLDEILDSGVDSSGLSNFISVLNNIVHEENSSDMGIYLISHKLTESSVNFDNIVEITKRQFFSEIKYTETKE